MGEPTTEAGRALLARRDVFPVDRDGWAARILAIEAEARATADAEIRRLRDVVEAARGLVPGWETDSQGYYDFDKQAVVDALAALDAGTQAE